MSMLIKHNEKINAVKQILENENSWECRQNLQQHLLPRKMKEYFAKLNEQDETTLNEDDNEPSIGIDFMNETSDGTT